MNKKLAVSILLLPLLAGGVVYANSSPNEKQNNSTPISTPSTHLKSSKGSLEVFPFDQGVEKADLIVKVKMNRQVDTLSEPVPKSIFEAQILSTPKEDPALKANIINIMQQGNNEFLFNDNPLFQQDEEYIFFLKKAVGPIAEKHADLYWILGEETNFYKSIDDNIIEKQGLVDEELADVQDNSGKSFLQEDQSLTQKLDEKAFIQKIEKAVNTESYTYLE